MATRRSILGIVLAGCFLNACAPRPKKFDLKEWKSSNSSSRGAMVQDLIDRRLLLGKTPAQVEDLLGRPDSKEEDWYGYKVVTISRCYFWECRMDVVFDKASSQVVSVQVSD
jgi:hypothetical protein